MTVQEIMRHLDLSLQMAIKNHLQLEFVSFVISELRGEELTKEKLIAAVLNAEREWDL